jgi:excisionase family DNA binding protein
MPEYLGGFTWLTVKMTARRLKVSRQRVYQLAAAGKLGWRKIDGMVLINAVTVEQRVKVMGKGNRYAD